MEPQVVNIASTPNLNLSSDPTFVKSDFSAAVWNKGYKVYHDKMMVCPCKTEEGLVLSTCKNCKGTGWFVFKRIETRMLLQAMNLDTRYKEWSVQKLGMVRITALNDAELSHNDRIIVLDGETTYNEVIYPKEQSNGDLFTFLFYENIRIIGVYLFDTDDVSLIKLVEGVGEDYIVDGDRFYLDKIKWGAKAIPKVSVRYICRPQYHIEEITRDLMISDTLELTGKTEDVKFPVAAVGRRSHWVFDKENLAKDSLNDNSQ